MFFSRLKRRKKRRSSGFQPEVLESRTLLAGDVSAMLRGDVLVLNGDVDANSVEVRPNEDGDVTVFGTGGTTINGSADPFVVTEGDSLRSISVRLGDGDDVLRIESLDISRNVFARGRSGNDAIGLYDTNVEGSVYFLGGRGDDSMSLDETTVGGKLLISGGRGADTIGVDLSSVDGATLLFAGSGDDRVAVRESIHNGFVTLSAGRGDDFVAIDGTEINAFAYAGLGSGDDQLVVTESGFTGTTFVRGGRGDDNAVVEDTDFARDPFISSIEGDTVETPEERTDELFLDLVASGARLGTIAELAILTPDLSTLVEAVVAAGLVDTLSGDTLLTVFAPTNSAFAGLPDGTLDDLLDDPMGALTDVLTYHVSPGVTDASTLVGLESVPTVNGATIDVTVNDDGVFLNETTEVIATDIRAKNGFVHLINEVLIPPAEEA